MISKLNKTALLAAVVGVSACGGSGDGGDDIIVSSGILELELPGAATQADLPGDLQDLVDDVLDANENGGGVAVPAGDTRYSGEFGFSIEDDDDDIFVWGNATVLVDDASGVSYNFAPNEIEDPNRPNAEVVQGNLVGDTTIDQDGRFNGTVVAAFIFATDGTQTETENFNVTGTVDGAFNADGEAFGSMTGEGGADNQQIDGLFFTTLNK